MWWTSSIIFFGPVFVMLFLSSNVRCGMLSDVSKVVVDTVRVLETPMTVRAILARFNNQNSVWIQLWKPGQKNTYSLVWQYKARPSRPTGQQDAGAYETINLPESDYIAVEKDYVLGMVNDVTPGPMLELYSARSGMVFSVQDSHVRGMPIREGTEFEFDDLSLPYHLPVCLCNFTECTEYGKQGCQPKKPEMTTGSGSDGRNSPEVRAVSSTNNSVLMSEEMIIGLITWNILLTFILFVVVCVLMWVCADMEKIKKSERSWKAKVANSPSMQSASSSSTRKRWPSNSSSGTDTMRSRSTLPGSHEADVPL